jgi:hypothetical protein
MNGRYLGEIVLKNQLLYNKQNRWNGTNFGVYGNYGNVGNYGSPENYGSIGQILGYCDIELEKLK